MKNKTLPLILAISLASCQVQPQIYGHFDPNDKRIAVPIKNMDASSFLKNALRNRGWDVRLSGTSTLTTTSENGNETIATTNGNARYTLVYTKDTKHEYDWLSGQREAKDDVQVTIYENKTSSEIISYGGFQSLDTSRVKTLLDAIEKATPKQ